MSDRIGKPMRRRDPPSILPKRIGQPITYSLLLWRLWMKARVYRLIELHQRVDEALRREIARRVPDFFTVLALKKRKLRIKDLISRLSPRPLEA